MTTIPPTEAPPRSPNPVTTAIQAILAQVKPTNEVAETERSLNLLKLGVEAQKLEAEKSKAEQEANKVSVDAALAGKQLRLSYLSAIFAPLVPRASLLTVAVTVWTASVQTQQARDIEAQKVASDERVRDTANWQSFRSTFDNVSADDLFGRPTFVSRLQEFSATDRHHGALIDVARPFLANLSSSSAFREVWRITYKQTTADNFDNVVSLARSKRRSFFELIDQCSEIPIPVGKLPDDKLYACQGPCSSVYSKEDLSKAYSDKAVLSKVLGLKDKTANATSMILFLSNEISEFVRNTSNKTSGAKPYDLSEVNFLVANLDEVDFSKMTLNQTRFAVSTVKGAILTPKVATYDFAGTAWWDAAAIDQGVLSWLISNLYPGGQASVFIVGNRITLDEYSEKISRLCTSKAISCGKECLKFGTSPAPVPDRCTTVPTKD